MEKGKHSDDLATILEAYDPLQPVPAAEALRSYWLRFEPKRLDGIKSNIAFDYEMAGIPVPELKTIGRSMAQKARKDTRRYLPLARTLWEQYGREGRVVALIILGAMELSDPEVVVPLLNDLCRSCVTWEDVDRLAMNALEPIIRKEPQNWLHELEPWLIDGNKWVRRAAAIVVGRLPMKHRQYVQRCLSMLDPLLADDDTDVKKGVSFAIRICAKYDPGSVRELLARKVPPADPAATWVLCDIIRSMGKKVLPEFAPLVEQYSAWLQHSDPDKNQTRSIESALAILENTARTLH